MDRQRQRAGSRRQRHSGRAEARHPEPVLITARRPDAPVLKSAKRRRLVAASAIPGAAAPPSDHSAGEAALRAALVGQPRLRPREGARIVQLAVHEAAPEERVRERLLDRLLASDGRSAITRAADAFRDAGFAFPEEQAVQIQLLEHVDEAVARGALEVLARLLAASAPHKRPVLAQRLRRLEDAADDQATRAAAAQLRRLARL